MKKYTEQIHAERLLKMLERPDPCATCPILKYFKHANDGAKKVIKIATDDNDFSCSVCQEFVGISISCCPCNYFGESEAIKRTWLALEEKGYLNA